MDDLAKHLERFAKNINLSDMGFIEGLTLPTTIKQTLILALAYGLFGIVLEFGKIPKALIGNTVKWIEAKSEAKRKIELGASDALVKKLDSDDELLKRTLTRYGRNLLTKQSNREGVAQKVLRQFSSRSVEDEPNAFIDFDWLTMFWDQAESKSSEEIQEIFARILAAEVVQPGAVSPHTLQTLSVLTSTLGKTFSRFCRLSIDDGESAFVIHPHVFAFQNIGPLEQYDITLNDLLRLDGAGLIRSVEALTLNWDGDKELIPEDINEFEKIDFAGSNAYLYVSGSQIRYIYLTQAGRELRNLIDLSPHPAYVETLNESLGKRLKFVGE